jgi:hypothetical protein
MSRRDASLHLLIMIEMHQTLYYCKQDCSGLAIESKTAQLRIISGDNRSGSHAGQEGPRTLALQFRKREYSPLHDSWEPGLIY